MGSELFFEGKKYISASRASKIIGYNSDYIGQLCRKGSLECRRVGRSWFVEEESLKSHKIVAAAAPRGRIAIYQKNQGLADALSRPISAGQKFGSGALSYRSLNINDLDFTDAVKEQRITKSFFRNIGAGVVVMLIAILVLPYFIFPEQRASVPTIVKNVMKTEVGLVQKFKSVSAYRNDLSDSIAYSANVFQSTGISIGQKAISALRGIHQGLAFVGNLFQDATNKARILVLNSDRENVKPGVVVLPSAKNDGTNDQVKEYVINSFSDEAKIVPDESGNSGLIKPVFKENKDQEYLYVIVPVKEGDD